MRRKMRGGAAWAAAMILSGCGSPGGGGADTGEERLPLPSFAVDAAVVPLVAELPGFEDGAPRPVAALADDKGHQAEFVADELWLSSDDGAVLSGLLARWHGEVVGEIDPASLGGGGLPRQVLVRIDPSNADPDRLAQDVRALDAGARGAHRVSSESGLRLLAAAAAEAASGILIGVNWVGRGADLRTRRTAEAPAGASWGATAYDPNAFVWPSHAADSPQDIGVAEAWRMLEVAGKLGNRVRLAVLDMGFVPNGDFPVSRTAISNVPFVDPIGTSNLIGCGGGPCPWHGTNVVSSAMALADDGFGAAGPAGPIADAVLVFTLYDFFTSISAVAVARAAGARVINMSYGAAVPAGFSWSVLPFEAATAVVRASGALLFAAAGNDGADVDSQDCFIFCWEDTLYTPCENAGVTCVGGIAWDSPRWDPGSNWGHGGVALFAPYSQWVGPDPSAPANAAQVIHGTSFASPFAAGVAALVWAANPSLSAGQVADILVRTAHTRGDSRVDRWVNARAAVVAALGDAPPFVRIVLPADGAAFPGRSTSIVFRADAEDLEDGEPTVTWRSDRDGVLGTGIEIGRTSLSYGTHRVTATATDRGGHSASDAVSVVVVNNPPTVEILEPADGSETYASSAVSLVGTGYDPNDGTLPASRLQWFVDGSPVATGNAAFIAGGTLALGARSIELRGSDGDLPASDSVAIQVVADPPGNVPPTAVITSPAEGTRFIGDQWDAAAGRYYANVALCGRGIDPEDGELAAERLAWSGSADGGAFVDFGSPSGMGCLTVRLDQYDIYESYWTIRLVATDAAADTGQADVHVSVYGVF
ncbi:MAG: S8 family serine peptidase [Deltaproteobacteria bacterium]|nr:S8 family serine peptidase [Deltaproteobacteria bacterium]